MKGAFWKHIFRTIKRSMGRYLAIFAIIALGVGFFCGLKASKPAMMKTGQEYVDSQKLYDYRIISTWGFDETEIMEIQNLEHIRQAEGAVWEDFLFLDEEGGESCLKAMSITEQVNLLTIKAGRLPQKADECVLDAYRFPESMIGQKITIASENTQETKDSFAYETYTVTGLVRTPVYMNMERGTTTIGNGKINSFMFLPLEGFSYEYYKELYVQTDVEGEAFSTEYGNAIEDDSDGIEKSVSHVLQSRYQQEITNAQEEIENAKKELADKTAEAEAELADARAKLEDGQAELLDAKEQLDRAEAEINTQEQALKDLENALLSGMVEYQWAVEQGKAEIARAREEIAEGRRELEENEQKIADGWVEYMDGSSKLEKETADAQKEIADAEDELSKLEEPTIYLLDRNTNAGYASFESDVSIVEGIATIFPIFFFLIAALVCSTTMTRMVDDERTQIGTLRAVGYSEGAILFKYIIYSGSAAGLGVAAGYILGTRLFPTAIWIAYDILYGFADIIIVDNFWLFLVSLLVSLLCSAGTTFAACRLELSHVPAELIRPKAPAAGKRIFLEYIPFFWKRLKFLHKVSARNVFRFKKRMIMMILGIAGCTSLVIAGFGVKDSVSNIANSQYDQILKYDISASYTEEVTDDMLDEIRKQFGSEIEGMAVLLETSVEAPCEDGTKTVTLMVTRDDNIRECVDFHLDGTPAQLPVKEGEILIDNRLSEVLSAKIGDEVTLSSKDVLVNPLKVSGIFENYTFYYAHITAETYEAYFNKAFEPKTIYLALSENADQYRIASYLSDMENAYNINVIADMRTRVENTMQSMNFIVALIIGCAAALAFIVLFNLGNINISERVREIATLKVLGFYPRETGSYVFRESMVLSIMGIIVGIPLGMLLHRFVMLQIRIDMVSFDIRVRFISYLYSVVAVLGFTVCVDLIMRRKINRIDMAESLKSIE